MSGSPITLPHEVHSGEHELAVVLLHSLALDCRVWDKFVGPLSQQRTVITLDLRGHGASPPDDEFTIELMADDVAATLTQLGVSRSAVVGMSMGGCVAQALAVRHADRVEELGLIDTTAWYGPDAPEAWESRAQKAREEGLESLALFQLSRWFTDDFRKRCPEVCQELLEVFASNDLASYVAACRALGAFDIREELKLIDVPTVIVVGEHDLATPPEHAADMESRIRGSALRVVPGTKHLTAVETPDEVLRHLRAVLE